VLALQLILVQALVSLHETSSGGGGWGGDEPGGILQVRGRSAETNLVSGFLSTAIGEKIVECLPPPQQQKHPYTADVFVAEKFLENSGSPFGLLSASAFSHPHATRVRIRQRSSGRRAVQLLPE